jgi:hypothetical protein
LIFRPYKDAQFLHRQPGDARQTQRLLHARGLGADPTSCDGGLAREELTDGNANPTVLAAQRHKAAALLGLDLVGFYEQLAYALGFLGMAAKSHLVHLQVNGIGLLLNVCDLLFYCLECGCCIGGGLAEGLELFVGFRDEFLLLGHKLG